MASDFIVVYLISKTLLCSEPRNPQNILLFFKVFKNALFWGEREKKMVVVCALLEHEIIMMIPAVAGLVVEFKLLKNVYDTAVSPARGRFLG